MARSINHVVLWCGLVPLAAASGGCQRGPTWNLAPVEGAITKDGLPLRGIEVVFLPDADTVGPRSSGLTDEAGHYRLRTDGGNDGAAVGMHRVCIHDTHHAPLPLGGLSKEKMKELNKKAVSASPQVPLNYGRPNETLLRAEVRSESQTLNFDLP